MRKLSLIIVAAAALAAIGSAHQGPRRGGFGPETPYNLVQRKDVGKEIKLTDDQAAKIRLAQDDMRSKMQQIFQDNQGDFDAARKAMPKVIEDFNTQVKGILNADQFTRLLQIYIQRAGTMSVTDADVQKTIKLTDDQIKQIKDLQAKQQEANGQLFQKVQSGEIDRSDVGGMMQKNNDILKTSIEKLLTDENKAALKTAAGEPFTFDPNEQPPGFGRPPGGGGGGGGGI